MLQNYIIWRCHGESAHQFDIPSYLAAQSNNQFFIIFFFFFLVNVKIIFNRIIIIEKLFIEILAIYHLLNFIKIIENCSFFDIEKILKSNNPFNKNIDE